MPRTLADVFTELDQLTRKRNAVRTQIAETEKLARTEGVEERLTNLNRSLVKLGTRKDQLSQELPAAIRNSPSGALQPGVSPSQSDDVPNDGTTVKDPWSNRDGRYSEGVDRIRVRGMEAVTRHAEHGLVPDAPVERILDAIGNGDDAEAGPLARWALAATDPAYQRAFASLLVDPARGHLQWSPEERAAFTRSQEVSRALSVGTPADGGYLVPFTLDPSVVLISDGTINPIRELARNVVTATNKWHGVASEGVTAQWKPELDETVESPPAFTQPTVDVHLGDVYVEYSYEAGMDAVGLVAELGRLFSDARASHESAAFTSGTGTGQPQGLVSGLGPDQTVTTGATGTFTQDSVFQLLEALPPRHRARATFMGPLGTLHLLAQAETSNGALLWPEIKDDRLLRRRLAENSEMDSELVDGNHILAVGDFSKYVVADRVGATIELIPNVVGPNRRPIAARGAYFWWRTGGDFTDVNAFRRLEVGA
jgi:HK97 family phage major capsid protein